MRNWLIIGLIIFFGRLTTGVFANENGDWQLWNTESIEGALAEDWQVKLEEEFRIGDDVQELYYHHADGGLTYKLTGLFLLGFNYRQIFEKRSGEFEEENRPHVNATIKWRWEDLSFKDRSRFEYRIRDGKKNVWRYRNKLSGTLPLKMTGFDIQPYLADEVFIDLDEGKFSRNRLYAGFGAGLMKHLKVDVFYLWQTSKKKEDWIDFNVIGVKLEVKP
ncbi:MAG: DUF2490 domain-containing protein [candidate division Zixibacteria bacterium]|nr:DUF2490 domain-containing protein [candidate division Zixibacteria bacterium]